MTRAEVETRVAGLKAWVREVRGLCGGFGGCDDVLDDLEDLRQHDEAQAAELVAANDRFARRDRRVAELTVESSRLEAEIERLRAALVAAAEHHLDEAKSRRGSAHYHAERARVLRSAAEGKP